MSHEIVVEFRGDHVYARHTGAASMAIVRDLLGRIVAACDEHRCYNILGESDPANNISVLDAFAHAALWLKMGLTMNHRVAWVNHNPKVAGTFEFIENVLRNRCLGNGHVFKNMAEARKWLLERPDPSVQ